MYTQATIPIENEQLFSDLKTMVTNALAAQNREAFLKSLSYYGIQPRAFERVLEEKVFEQMKGARAGQDANALYSAMSSSDQSQIREFYLTEIEAIPADLRMKFRKVFQYQ